MNGGNQDWLSEIPPIHRLDLPARKAARISSNPPPLHHTVRSQPVPRPTRQRPSTRPTAPLPLSPSPLSAPFPPPPPDRPPDDDD